jgi:hypothetical protein
LLCSFGISSSYSFDLCSTFGGILDHYTGRFVDGFTVVSGYETECLGLTTVYADQQPVFLGRVDVELLIFVHRQLFGGGGFIGIQGTACADWWYLSLALYRAIWLTCSTYVAGMRPTGASSSDSSLIFAFHQLGIVRRGSEEEEG